MEDKFTEKKRFSEKFSYVHKVQYYETDQMKIVHHSNYIRWFEECRVAWMEDAKIPCHELEKKGIIIPVVDVSCKYKNMTRFGEEVEVIPAITKFNGVVIEFSYEIYGKESGKLKVTGTSSHCFLDPDSRVISLKKSHKDIYEAILNYVK